MLEPEFDNGEARENVPVTNETAVEESIIEESAVEESVVEESPVKESVVEESPVKESVVEESAVQESPVKESVVEESVVEESVVEESPVKESVVEKAADEAAPKKKAVRKTTTKKETAGAEKAESDLAENKVEGVDEKVEGVDEEIAGKKKVASKPKSPRLTKPKKDKSETAKKSQETDSPAETEEQPDESKYPKGMNWYILKVQVNREDTIKRNLERRVKIAGLDSFFGDILVPMEKVTEIRNEKKRIVSRKLYPGYLMIQMEINDDTWYLVRETSGIGDFTGAIGKPTPMQAHEVQRMLSAEKDDEEEQPKLKVGYSVGDSIKIKEGSFENLSGVVDTIDYTSGRVTVIINLFGRSTPVELEYWQIEQSSG
ncbi:MAG: transcription termination/antitermination protein NusG [Planctomycetaceae bacterium]|jgi:transcriptional antiterminator NusG|nr:transcription termination/antitermination protein NusG [Planctomycetaceae bacterium]